MPRRQWRHPDLNEPKGFSRAIEAPVGRTIYLSGQVPTDAAGAVIAKGNLGAQTRVCLEKIQGLVEVAGGSISDVIKLNFYVTDMSRMPEVRDVREEFLTSPPFPAMTGVEVTALANPDFMIEIEAIAVVEDATR